MFENFKKIKMPKKFSAWHIVIAVGFFILLQLYLLNPGVRDVSYSEFKRLVREGTVLECHITNTVIRGKLREIERETRKNVVFITARVDDPDLVKELEFVGVKYSGNYESPWFKTFFFTWVMPLLILFIIWRFIFKRFGPASSIMSFGKSKGRLYAQEDLNITFDDVAGIQNREKRASGSGKFGSIAKCSPKAKRKGRHLPRSTSNRLACQATKPPVTRIRLR